MWKAVQGLLEKWSRDWGAGKSNMFNFRWGWQFQIISKTFFWLSPSTLQIATLYSIANVYTQDLSEEKYEFE